MLGFLAGLFIGGAVGVLAVCLCIAAADPGKNGDQVNGKGKRTRG